MPSLAHDATKRVENQYYGTGHATKHARCQYYSKGLITWGITTQASLVSDFRTGEAISVPGFA
eukprot:2915776-Rhodomonas_salina.4